MANEDLTFKWDLKSLEIRTKSVERTLEPLVTQVTTLVSTKGPSSKKKGRSKRAHVLVEAVKIAIDNFIEKGVEILRDPLNQHGRSELEAALQEVQQTGNDMMNHSRAFAEDPCSSVKRTNMVKASRALLSAVTRLLIVADMIDVQILIRALESLKNDLDGVVSANNQQELNDRFGRLNRNLDSVSREAAQRAADLKDPNHRDDVIAARAVLKKSNTMLQTASKAFVRHPEVDPIRQNRDFAYGQMLGALAAMKDALEGRSGSQLLHGQIGDLAAALDDFDHRVYVDPSTYKDHVIRPSLEEQLERIISGAALIADSSSTRDDRKSRIVQECNAVRQALQDLLSEYEKNVGRKEPSEHLDMALIHLGDKTRDLRRHLRRAVVDHISDSFLDIRVPLSLLIEAAKQGDQQRVEHVGRMFVDHANKMVEVANLTCQMSNNEDGVKMVRYVADQVQKLAPQVVNAARLLAARPQSKVAQENMEAFREAWEEKVRVLTLAVDNIMTVDDFLAVSEAHILEDVHNCIQAVNMKDAEALDRTAGAIRGRAIRVCDVVDADMESYQPSLYTEKVREAVRVVRTNALPDFARRAQLAVDALSRKPPGDVDAEDLIDATQLVYNGIKDIRHAVLMNRQIDDIDSDEEYEYDQVTEKASRHSDKDEDNARAMMQKIPQAEKIQIQAQVKMFELERQRFNKEIGKWDDAGNDIIVLAKHMCMIMMEMTDFTRGRGPLKTTMDVINAAKKISEAGTKLNALAKQIADECVESETKKDLLAYLQRITLYCHQLNITSKVKADVQQVGDNLVVSGLESATSLIQSAKNLLNAVVLTVKAAYIASTKYPARGAHTSSMVVWKMRAPGKKPLYRHDQQPPPTPAGGAPKPHGIIRRASQKRELEPMKMLAEFHADSV